MGLFDGVVNQAQGVLDQEYTQKFKPLFDQAVAELQADRAADQHLDASVTALTAYVAALMQQMAALNQHIVAINTHPTVAAKPAVAPK